MRKFLTSFNNRNANIFLSLLLLGDLFYLVLHTINVLTPPRNPLLHLGTDQGFAEFFQYIKYFWIVVLLIYLAVKDKSFRYAAWAMLFIYFLADDSLQFHEGSGKYFETNFTFVPPFGLSLLAFGELAISAIVGSILLIPLIWAYRSGSTTYRKISKDLILLVMILLGFGIGVDSINELVDFGQIGNFFETIFEDAGELMSVSIIAWYVFLLNVRDINSDKYLVDCLMSLFKKRSP